MELHDFCKNGDIDNVKFYLNYENINNKDNYGNTPLHLACEHGHINIVNLLININDFNSLNDTNMWGNTPFGFACSNGWIDIVRLLINCDGFDRLNDKNILGYTPLALACYKGHVDIVKLLISSEGFDSLNDENNYNFTPFSLACRNGLLNIVKLLLTQRNIIIPDNLNCNDEIKLLIESYKKDPNAMRLFLIIDHNLDVYRHIIFTSDEYFIIKNIDNNCVKFFNIVVKLPIEIQMLIIMRLSGLMMNIITSKMFYYNINLYVDKYLL